MTLSRIRATRTADWACGDLSARVTYTPPTAREAAAFSAAVAGGGDIASSMTALVSASLLSAAAVRRGDDAIGDVPAADLIDALTMRELDSLGGVILRGDVPQ